MGTLGTLCVHCKKNIAVVFVTRMEKDKEPEHQGFCLKCARELNMNIGPFGSMFKQMGMTDDDMDAISSGMSEMLSDPSALMSGLGVMNEGNEDNDDDSAIDDEGKTATFPFLDRIFQNQMPLPQPDQSASANEEQPKQAGDGQSADGGRPGRDKKRENGRDNKAKQPKKLKFLDSYCLNLTGRARDGKLDRIVGRGDETERVIQIINRRQKNNPCLIGEPGVGKTAIAEGLALRIAEGSVPDKLKDKEVYLLDLTSLVAGTQFRGQFESRMKGLIEEIKRTGNIILVIDEVHTLVGAGDAEGSMNAANILKPALSRGEIQVIGATTFAEYRKHIEKDAALERRFQPVIINEPSVDESVKILEGIAHYYEQHHGISVDNTICRAAVTLSERYITDRFLPDKAIDLLDEAASSLNLSSEQIAQAAKLHRKLRGLDEEIALLQEEEDVDYEALAACKSKSLQLKEDLQEVMKDGAPKLTVADLARVIEQWTKVPASSIAAAEFEKLNGLPERLKKRIVGQDDAIIAITAAIARNRVGLSPKRKPVSLIFAGPTGVGKTELVKLIAADMFDTPESLIRLDMSEFMEKHAVSRIIGSPPGYVGYDEAGQLTEKIRRKPYSVVLFDEIEKAHPDVLNVLLQVLDDGYITDAHGRKVNFENTILVMTTNAGSDKKTGSIGFGRTDEALNRDRTMKALKDFLRPEFLNRVDEIVVFNPLPQEHFKAIAVIMMDDLAEAASSRGLTLTYDALVPEWLAKQAFSEEYGARHLRRYIQKEIEDKIASLLVERYADVPSGVTVSVDSEQLVVIS
ncbi:MAG: ATP-dependent Clp protease ATP-binding subunit [Oscillospiraceae bacterium]|nr:ATP-dependent Clp protease ATP-binding subunit [Oscillospiraceae bacterium]